MKNREGRGPKSLHPGQLTPNPSNPKKILRANLSTLQHQFQSIQPTLSMRAAKRSARRKWTSKRKRSKTELLHSMGRRIPAAQNHTPNSALLYNFKHHAPESHAEFFIMGRPRRRTQRRIKHSIPP
jgi:hypothetical protein